MTTKVGLSEKLYRSLLAIYPTDYRREYGPLMAQVFRDMQRATHEQEGVMGVARLWLHTAIDLGATAGAEHYAEFRRTMMGKTLEKLEIDPRYGAWLLITAMIIAAGVLTKAFVKESGGSLVLGASILIAANLLAAIIMEAAIRTRGLILVSACILIAGYLLPIVWEDDPARWLQENPMNIWLILLLGLWSRPRGMWWMMPVTAFILGAIQVAVSLLL